MFDRATEILITRNCIGLPLEYLAGLNWLWITFPLKKSSTKSMLKIRNILKATITVAKYQFFLKLNKCIRIKDLRIYNFFKISKYVKRFSIYKRKNLHHYHPGHVLFRINPKESVGKACPRQTAWRSPRWSGFLIDHKA